MDADDKLRTRLENHIALSQTAQRGTGGVLLAFWLLGLDVWVELTKGGLIEKLVSCADICCRTETDGSGAAGWRSGYD